MVEQGYFRELSTDTPQHYLCWMNRPQVREALIDEMRRKGEELQEDLEVDAIPLGMAVTLWESMQADVPSEELEEQLGEDAVIEIEKPNPEDKVWNLLAGLDSEEDILEALQGEGTKLKLQTGLATEGREFQKGYMIEYKALTPVDVGFLLKNRRFTLSSPSEVMKKQTA